MEVNFFKILLNKYIVEILGLDQMTTSKKNSTSTELSRNRTLFLDDKTLVSSCNNLIQVYHSKINDV